MYVRGGAAGVQIRTRMQDINPIPEEPTESAAQNNVDSDARYLGSYADRRILTPLRPSYSFPRLYQGLYQAMYEKLRSVPNVDLVDEFEEIMIDKSTDRDNKLRVTACAVEASIEDLLTACLICLASSRDLYLDLSEIAVPVDDMVRSLEILFGLFFDVELNTIR